jgi:hypothetical protein
MSDLTPVFSPVVDHVARRLAGSGSGRPLSGPVKGGGGLRQAEVVAVVGGPPPTLTLAFAGADPIPGFRFLASYTPQVGDSVWLLPVGSEDYIVAGALA